MAYYLTSGTKKDNTLVDITKSFKFKKTSKFKSVAACSLQEIDNFTINFNDVFELKNHLFFEGILSQENYDKKLEIRYRQNGELKKLIYDIIYKENAYLLNTKNLVYKLESYLNDFEFLRKFIVFFRDYNECLPEISELSIYLHDTIENNYRSKYLTERYFDAIYRLIESKSSYKNIHTLVAFIINYENKKNENNNTNNNDNNNSNNPKRRTKKKEGDFKQLTLFDF